MTTLQYIIQTMGTRSDPVALHLSLSLSLSLSNRHKRRERERKSVYVYMSEDSKRDFSVVSPHSAIARSSLPPVSEYPGPLLLLLLPNRTVSSISYQTPLFQPSPSDS